MKHDSLTRRLPLMTFHGATSVFEEREIVLQLRGEDGTVHGFRLPEASAHTIMTVLTGMKPRRADEA